MDYNEVKELIGIIEGTDFTSFSLNIDGVAIAIERVGGKHAEAQSAVQEAAGDVAADPDPLEKPKGNYVTSPIVGTFYASPTPDAPAFVKVGDRVKKGDVLCIVEAMKFMNEITSEFDGTVTKILAEDQAMVEYGQQLFCIV